MISCVTTIKTRFSYRKFAADTIRIIVTVDFTMDKFATDMYLKTSVMHNIFVFID